MSAQAMVRLECQVHGPDTGMVWSMRDDEDAMDVYEAAVFALNRLGGQ